jgi:hypothetical protein
LYDEKVEWLDRGLSYDEDIEDVMENLLVIVEDMKGTSWELTERVLDKVKASIDLARGNSWLDGDDDD